QPAHSRMRSAAGWATRSVARCAVMYSNAAPFSGASLSLAATATGPVRDWLRSVRLDLLGRDPQAVRNPSERPPLRFGHFSPPDPADGLRRHRSEVPLPQPAQDTQPAKARPEGLLLCPKPAAVSLPVLRVTLVEDRVGSRLIGAQTHGVTAVDHLEVGRVD